LIDIPRRERKRRKKEEGRKKKKKGKKERVYRLFSWRLTGGILSGMRNTWRTTFWQPLVYSILKKKKKGRGKYAVYSQNRTFGIRIFFGLRPA
jgi:hypothetical protein